ncbi:MAG: bifunctional [glutamate--ammonia ligase]-adenylyl-L-tyrosine phosphorylase/[glutamate--ammonia-ligase] adenylyltransferase [Gallionellaceae bacterium]|nr:bifunctional [glutamate--ammonia ligase]-adenylyl-L-tyrosine phosphorylase/[glutamate--ammonia-ligase] adenylyltransferase [Gallionellaceae bacterium]
MTPFDSQIAIAKAADFSRYLRGRLDARPELGDWLTDACQVPFTRQAMDAFLAETPIIDEDALKRRLRDLRQRIMAVVIVRDLNGLADLAEVTRTCTDLAEAAFALACDWLHRDLAEVHGEPLDSLGRPQRLIVVGMGKLGGRELNVSSDVDPIFVYPEDGETAGPRKLASHEFFVRLGRRMISAIGETTVDGFVFRVDMRLRPYGDEGPLVSSFAMLEEYFYTQAREWERYAWIKARPLTGARHDELEELRKPFVFRKYLDFGAFAAMRDLHAQIRREVARKDKTDNIKLGPGGIREIEFIAQVFQLIRGGKTPALQTRPTRRVLRQLAAMDLLPEQVASDLEAAYVMLRDLEHRLQYRDDLQTQQLPHASEERGLLARTMAYADWEGFEAHLNSIRRKVAGQFEQVFGAPQEDQSNHPLAGLCNQPPEAARSRLDALGYDDCAAVLERLAALRSSSRYAGLPAVNKTALDGLLPPLIEVAARQANPDDTLTRILTLLEAISRRAPYLLLLREYPQTLAQVARIVGASPWAARYLTNQPHLLDELLDPRALMSTPDWSLLRDELKSRLAAFDGDLERQMDELRHFKQSETFRLLAQDLAGMWTLEHLSDQLAALADLLLAQTLELVWADLPRKHCARPAFAVIAYGKLGGKELGYASDLDIVFLYDDPHPDAQDLYARLGKRMNTWMSTLTGAGVLYETDLRLRPDGAAGLLVSSIEAFDDYQHHHAWTWEHQAITRARYSCGDATVGEQFATIRDTILRLPRDLAKLRTDVLEMRQKMRDGHPNASELFDLKHDRGGLVDVEFAMQYLILAHSAAQPELTANRGNIALLGIAGGLGLIPAGVAADAADAYRELRRRQHQVKLQGAEHARLPAGEIAGEITAVGSLWQAVFGQ